VKAQGGSRRPPGHNRALDCCWFHRHRPVVPARTTSADHRCKPGGVAARVLRLATPRLEQVTRAWPNRVLNYPSAGLTGLDKARL
jgi:hypothetical protein